MAYSKAQCIGFQLNTFPEFDYIWDPKALRWKTDYLKSKYLGLANDDADIRSRCSVMKDAIAFADKQSTIDRSDKTLKIFMAPEFFFRGSRGAYPVEKVSMIMENLRAFTKDKRFAHWLFVFGTALGSLGHLLDTEIFNLAMVQKGGVGSSTYTHKTGPESDSFIVYKEYISHIDFLRDAKKKWSDSLDRDVRVGGTIDLVAPTMGSRDISVFGSSPSGVTYNEFGHESLQEINKTGLGGGSIFTIDGITFGLEVCLDHFKRRLRAADRSKGKPRVQVQLIPSAGMSIEEDAIAVCDDGLIFNVDGGGTSAHSALQVLDLEVFNLITVVSPLAEKSVVY